MDFGLLFLIIAFTNTSRSWEFCQSEIQTQICGKETHFICNYENSIAEPSQQSKKFLAHVPLTRKVKTAFLNWHNYYRNRAAGGWAKNLKKNIVFPTAVRMRELLWDNELSYLSHARTKLVSDGEVACRCTQRFPHVGQNLIVKAFEEYEPVLKIIALSLREMFDEKENIENPNEMPAKYLEKNQFVTMINDQVSRIGCSVALGADCSDKDGNQKKFCYYTACMYGNDYRGRIYKVGPPARKCSKWETRRSKTYIFLCENSGKLFDIET